jgi:hypothetical protein
MCGRLSKYSGLLLLASCASAIADQTESQQLHGALVSAKISGGCTTLVQMAEFQKSTKMPGGDEFLERFLGMESARLGKTPSQYVQMCADADRVYQFYYQLTSDAGGSK